MDASEKASVKETLQELIEHYSSFIRLISNQIDQAQSLIEDLQFLVQDLDTDEDLFDLIDDLIVEWPRQREYFDDLWSEYDKLFKKYEVVCSKRLSISDE